MQPRQQMKDANIPWFDKIPRHWTVSKVSMLFAENKNTNYNLRSKIPMQFKFGEIIEKRDQREDSLEEIRRYTVVEPDDIMVNGLNLNYDFLTQRVAIVKQAGCITPAYISLRPRGSINPQYYGYLLKSLDSQKILNALGTGIRLTLNYSGFKRVFLPVPSPQEQKLIARFLDTELAKLDGLIAKQEHLLKLLEEKRRATITAAVTRGLNPDAELKATGTAWLPQIPAHWELKKLKYLFTVNDEVLGQETKPGLEFDYVDISSVDKYEGIIKRETMTFEKAPSRARRVVKNGDIIVGTVRTYLEAIAQITKASEDVIVSTGFAVLRPFNTADTNYYSYAIRSGVFMANVVAHSDGVSYPGIGTDRLVSLSIPVPPKDERVSITSYIADETKKMDALKKEVFKQIDLLKERRASVISHAVTGRMEV